MSNEVNYCIESTPNGEHRISYYPNGTKKWEGWYSESQVLHRKGNPPAFIEYTPDGKKDTASWYHNGELISEWWYLDDGSVCKWKKDEVIQPKKK
jgi:antitoxin component YwqK of YwqJK toxin-antitoxin module